MLRVGLATCTSFVHKSKFALSSKVSVTTSQGLYSVAYVFMLRVAVARRCAPQTEASYNTTSSVDATRCELADRLFSRNAPWYDETIEATGRTRPCEWS